MRRTKATATPSGLPAQVDADVWPILRQTTGPLLEQIAKGDHDSALKVLQNTERAHYQRVLVLVAIEDRIAKLEG